MAWEWSHANEAYGNARANLYAKPRQWLMECWAETAATRYDHEAGCWTSDLDLAAYEAELISAQQHHDDVLASAIWSFAEEHRTCDNGGFNAHMCPHGCHTVSFDDLGNLEPEG